MAEFLSAGWFADLDGAEVGAAPDVDVRIGMRITGGPDGDVGYCVRVAGGRLHIDDGAPDITLELPYTTAIELRAGRRSAHDAFLAGDVRCRGDFTRLPALTAVVAAIATGP